MAPAASAVRTRRVEAPVSPAVSPVEPPVTPRKVEAPILPPATPVGPSMTPRRGEAPVPSSADASAASVKSPVAAGTAPLPETASSVVSSMAARNLPQPASPIPPSHGIATSQRSMLNVGEDDLAIFEQMRHQLLVWLRIEAVSAGLEIANQGPAQLLEMLRQQARFDETRLQVVSTLLNLSTQVIKTGTVSVLDYKQALMFHLMHTKR